MGKFVVDSDVHNDWKKLTIEINNTPSNERTEDMLKKWDAADTAAFQAAYNILKNLTAGNTYKVKYSKREHASGKFVEIVDNLELLDSHTFYGIPSQMISSVEEIPPPKGGKRKSIKNNRKNHRKNHRNNRSKKNRKNRPRY